MVHALHETQRVLRSGGTLIDLRPVVSSPPIELLRSGEALLVDHLDDSIDLPEDQASDEALRETVSRGWFRHQARDAFSFSYYWDTPDEMITYVTTEANWTETIPEGAVSRLRQLAAEAEGPVRVRIQLAMALNSYLKSPA